MAQANNSNEHQSKCAHEGCNCMIAPSQHFCSDYCAKSSDAAISGTLPGPRTKGPCKCGHPDCQG
jgi:hypothetical protein